MSKKENLKSKSFNDAKIKVSDADIKKYAKKLKVVSKGKLIGSLIGGVALVGGGVGATTYFAINNKASVEGAGTIIVDPSIESKDASISALETDTSGNKVSTVTSETRIIVDIIVSVGNKTLVNGVDYCVSPRNELKSDLKVTIYKETYEKYSSQGAFRITPQFAEKCLILFDTDGGSEIQPLSVEAGQKATKPNNPTKEGYEFVGWWYTNDQGQYVEFDFNTEIKSNLILHAKWQIPVTTVGVGYHYDGTGYLVYCNDFEKLPEKVRIPETYTDPVTNITANVIGFYNYNDDNEYDVGFTYCYNLKEIELPETIDRIDTCAFFRCQSLEKINIPSKVKYIDDYAFERCYKLSSINLPEGLVSIGEYAFDYCNFESIVLPKSLQLLGEGAFSNNYSLNNVVINEGITTIPYYCFAYCSLLGQVTLPISVTSIVSGAFTNAWITNIIRKDNFSKWEDETGEVLTEDNFRQALYGGVYDCYKCSYNDSTSNYKIQFMGYSDDEHTKANCSIQYIGEGVEELLAPDKLTIDNYDIDFIPTRIAANFDQSDSGIQNLILRSNYTTIAPKAFDGSNVLKSVSFKSGDKINLKSIGDKAFTGAESLIKFNSDDNNVINLPESLEYLGIASFQYCTLIEQIKINSDLDLKHNDWANDDDGYYSSYPFDGCSNVKSYAINENNSYYKVDENTGALYTKINKNFNELVAYPNFNEGSEKEIKIADGAISIAYKAFAFHDACAYATKLVIPTTLKEFNDCFSYNPSYAECFPFAKIKSFELLGESAYFSVSNNTLFDKDKTELIKFAVGSSGSEPLSYNLPNTVTTIRSRAFCDVSNLTSINLENVEYIEYEAFTNCEQLTGILTLTNIKEIDSGAFYYCNLNEIHIGANCTYIDIDAFTGVPDDCKLYIDSDVIANYTEDDCGSEGRLFKNNVYIKKGIIVKPTSYLVSGAYADPVEEGDYMYYRKN